MLARVRVRVRVRKKQYWGFWSGTEYVLAILCEYQTVSPAFREWHHGILCGIEKGSSRDRALFTTSISVTHLRILRYII